MDIERAFFRLKLFFYLKDRGEETNSFSSDDDADRASPNAEGVIHGFKDEKEIDDEEALEDGEEE